MFVSLWSPLAATVPVGRSPRWSRWLGRDRVCAPPVGFTLMCVAFLACGVLMIMAGLAKWMGVVAILLGGIMPWLGFLPLWWFVAGVALAIGLLRWERRTRDLDVAVDLASA